MVSRFEYEILDFQFLYFLIKRYVAVRICATVMMSSEF